MHDYAYAVLYLETASLFCLPQNTFLITGRAAPCRPLRSCLTVLGAQLVHGIRGLWREMRGEVSISCPAHSPTLRLQCLTPSAPRVALLSLKVSFEMPGLLGLPAASTSHPASSSETCSKGSPEQGRS